MKIYNWIITVVLLLSVCGCNDWLDVSPEDTVDEKELFATGEGYRNALNGVYRQMSLPSLYGQEMSWGLVDVMGQVYSATGLTVYNPYGIVVREYDYDNSVVEPLIQAIWSDSYNAIANCNNIVGRITGEVPSKFRGGE